MSNNFDQKVARALLDSARANKATLLAVIELSKSLPVEDEKVSKALNGAIDAWEQQLISLEEMIRG